ncbi:esterase-like activity of phytase family protein [Rubrivivax gelatinosus]|uniref:PEP-CTERM sorting domain-containing protein n=1 Tax=Rubrivivax gelatinosus TaxID=28068 RepID=A0ABS1E191_RUBGE|nr:esterase-like activity of phytase family protein [Rubrivivax gelatinosus]MBK1715171.1 PEP-CTERM sorting domain-containing protein [Rubrivivax gelatinosus]
MTLRTLTALLAAAWSFSAGATPTFVNALAIDGSSVDASGGTSVNDGRLGFFSDIYYDAARNEWWALSDRGPGGGTMHYETRVQRFSLDVDRNTGAISNFQVLQTLIFRKGGQSLDGFAPGQREPLGLAFDPEGIVVNPANGHLLVSDEYGPSLVAFTRKGQLLRRYTTPANVVPREAASGTANYASDSGNDAGKRNNRGFEGLAVSPNGRWVFAMLQSAMLDEGAGDGVYNRIVRFDALTGRAVAQYAYKMEGSSQGRGISALVALNDHEFLVLERNNRGIGVDAELSPANKKVFRIDLTGATDVSTVDLDAAGAVFTPVTKQTTPWLDLAGATALASPELAALGGVSPEKWEGLAIGPKLADGSHLVLAGTDNDYSVTQDASSVQHDVYIRALTGGGIERIRCDIGSFANCLTVDAKGSAGAALPAGYDFSGYHLIPGVLHAYKATPEDLLGYQAPRRGSN